MKQTNNENGSVIATKTHDKIVNALPQASASVGFASSAETAEINELDCNEARELGSAIR